MTPVEAKRLEQILGSVKMAEAMMAKNAREAKKYTSKELLAKAVAMDEAGDRYKAQGKIESAKACYSRALTLAIKAGV